MKIKDFYLRNTKPEHYRGLTGVGYFYILFSLLNVYLDSIHPNAYDFSIYNVILRPLWALFGVFFFWQSRHAKVTFWNSVGFLLSWALYIFMLSFYLYYSIVLF